MKKSIACIFLASEILSGILMFASDAIAQKPVASQSSVSSSEKNSKSILSEEESKSILDLANNLELPCEELQSVLSFKAKDKNCSLVPICDSKAHKDCFIRIFAKSDSDYMKYYGDGKIKTVECIENWFSRSLSNLKQKFPKSITLLINVEGETIGRIGTGPLHGDNNADPEIGYALEESYSGQGIMSQAVKAALDFLQYLKNNSAQNYKFTRIRATAKIKNIPSNAILESRGFKKSKSKTGHGNSLRNKYFYYFK